MKKFNAMLASLLVLGLLVSALPMVSADYSGSGFAAGDTVPPETTVPPEYEPASWFPQEESISIPAPALNTL